MSGRWLLIAALLGASHCRAADGPAPSMRAFAAKPGVKIDVSGTDSNAIVDIACVSGIGKARLERTVESWPKAIVVRLRLKGLESFQVRHGDIVVQWSVASTGENAQRVSVRRGKDNDEPIDATSPLYSTVRLVARGRQIPLQDGYFEVRLPRGLLDGSRATMELEWIDFYRD